MGLEDLPAVITAGWGIPLIVSQLLLTTVICAAFVFPVLIFLRGQDGKTTLALSFAFFFMALLLCTGLGWVSPTAVVGIIAILAIGGAIILKDVFGG